MFWDNFYKLCRLHGETPASVCKNLGLSNAVATRWKKGNIPNTNTLNSIAKYFSVQISELFAPSKEEEVISLSSHERKLIAAYRSKPEIQSSIDKLLDVQETDVSILLEKVKARIESGELNPANAKIAAFGGYTKPKSNKEKERLAEIESLLKSIKEMQENAE